MGRKKNNNIIKWIVIITPLLIIFFVPNYFGKTDEEIYEKVEAKKENIVTYVSFSGNIESKNRQKVISEKIMQISKLNVKEGDIVYEGDIILETSLGEEIKAEIDGEVANINVEENAQVMAGTLLMEIVDYENLELNVKVDEYNLYALEEGQETTVTIGALDKEIIGYVSSISKEGQVINGVTFFIATIDLEKDDSLRIGMSAEGKIIKDFRENVVTLPMKYISFDEYNEPYVLKKNENGEIVETKIIVGINDGSIVEVIDGVYEGDTIYYKNDVDDNIFPSGGNV